MAATWGRSSAVDNERRQPVPFATQSAEQRTSGNSIERLVNMMVSTVPANSKYPVDIIPTTGAKLLDRVDDTPVSQVKWAKDRFYFTTGVGLYELTPKGTPAGGDRGNLLIQAPFGPNVEMATNGVELVIVDGERGWWWSTETKRLTELSGDGWYPAATVDYIDSRFIFTRNDTGQFFLSELNSVELDAQNFATAEGSPDNTEAVLVDHREAWLFGTDSGEVWANTGDADFTLERYDGAFIERGIGAKYSAAKLDNSVFWVGDDRIVYRAQGYVPVRVSTHAVEKDLSGPAHSPTDLTNTRGYTYAEDGHTFYCLTIPSINKTWVLDISTQRWHERSSGICDVSYGNRGAVLYPRHLANCADSHDGRTIVGDYRFGAIYELSVRHETEGAEKPVRVAVGPYMHDNRRFISPSMLELDLQYNGKRQQDPDCPNDTDPDIIMLDWTDDGERWGKPRIRHLPTVNKRKRKYKFYDLGEWEQRAFRYRSNSNTSIIGCYVSA